MKNNLTDQSLKVLTKITQAMMMRLLLPCWCRSSKSKTGLPSGWLKPEICASVHKGKSYIVHTNCHVPFIDRGFT
jgi:hypothetical protein